MQEYKIRDEISKYIKDKIDTGINEYVNQYGEDTRYLLSYPLINIEIGLEKEGAESISNWSKRATAGFLIDKIYTKSKNNVFNTNIDNKQFKFYKDNLHDKLADIMQANRIYYEIKDMNSIAKSRIETIEDNKHKITTSLVSDKYKEEAFYFHGLADTNKFESEMDMIKNGIEKFEFKYFTSKEGMKKLNRLHIEIDKETLEYCNSLVNKDLHKLGKDTKSNVFRSLDDLGCVISFLYYLSFTRKKKIQLFNILRKEFNYSEYILCYTKEWLINKIVKEKGISENKVKRILEYLVNDGTQNLLEFPLFEQGEYIITIPSLIVINDWQFTIVNGHYYKDCKFSNELKTISSTIENNLDLKLKRTNNVIVCKSKYYEYRNIQNDIVKSDIDLGIYDIKRNKLLIIEAKWKKNHYHNEGDKKYIKIQDTLNKIFNEQISKHKELLTDRNRLIDLFDNNDQIKGIQEMPETLYIGVDKRNQLHINGKHMITEFMLQYFIAKYSDSNDLNLEKLFDELKTLKTKVEYIESGNYDTFNTDNGVEFIINENELRLHYEF